jgi:hypothetical protein
MPFLIETTWNGQLHHALEPERSKATMRAIHEGRARAVEVPARVAANVDLDSLVVLLQRGLLE